MLLKSTFLAFKHRKNCECCPGHYLIVNHYSLMSWFKFCYLSVIVNCVNCVTSLNRCLCSDSSDCSDCSDCSDSRLWLLVGPTERQTLIELFCLGAVLHPGQLKKTALKLHLHSNVDKLFGAFPVNGAQIMLTLEDSTCIWGSKTKRKTNMWFKKVDSVRFDLYLGLKSRQLIRFVNSFVLLIELVLLAKKGSLSSRMSNFFQNLRQIKHTNLSQEKRDIFPKCDCPFLMNLDQC